MCSKHWVLRNKEKSNKDFFKKLSNKYWSRVTDFHLDDSVIDMAGSKFLFMMQEGFWKCDLHTAQLKNKMYLYSKQNHVLKRKFRHTQGSGSFICSGVIGVWPDRLNGIFTGVRVWVLHVLMPFLLAVSSARCVMEVGVSSIVISLQWHCNGLKVIARVQQEAQLVIVD